VSVRLSRATFRVLGLAMLLESTLSHAQDIAIAIVGDAIGPYEPITPQRDARFEQVMAILKGADAAFANQEGSVFDLAGFSGSVGAEDGGGHPLATSSVARDFKLMGLGIMSKANNHAVDFGLEGLRASEQSLDSAGIVHAGSGDSEAAARAPAYLVTSKGRFALMDRIRCAYQGRPIFFGMASLFTSIGGPDRAFRGHHLSAAYDGSVIAVVEYHDHHFVRIKLYPITIIYTTTNGLGTGYSERLDVGLFRLGEQVVSEMNALGMLIDLSHCSEATTLQAIALSGASAVAQRLCLGPDRKILGANFVRTFGSACG
jgi:Bacterial capsule synthesis protein PGA_cap/Membrane dipeptidase (Peptidase family M19)